jgi:DNA-binding response OmpR family regulator
METYPQFPTILIVQQDRGLRTALVRNLQSQGYAVLQASGANEDFEIVRTHSRHIHLLVTDDSADSRISAANLKQYRPSMDVLFLSSSAKDDPVTIEEVVMQIHDIVKPPASAEFKAQSERLKGRSLAKGV